MFASIRDSLNKPQESNFKDILKIEAGKTYLLRLLPNIKEPSQTFFHYFHYSWNSAATGQFVSFVSPQTVNERCPLAEESYKIYRQGSPEEKERGKQLYRKENYLVNVFVISDPTDPTNDGKVKILRYGKQLNKIIRSAIEGDDSQEFGERIFDLSEKGCTFRIKCEKKSDKNSEFVEYVASRFLSPSKIDGIDPQKIAEAYSTPHDLTKVFTIKTFDELNEALQEHYYNVSKDNPTGAKSSKKVEKVSSQNRVSTDEAPDDVDIPESAKTTTPVSVNNSKPSTTAAKSAIADTQIDELLKGLDSLG